MELEFRNKTKEKTVKVSKAIISISTLDKSIIENFIEDYDVVVVDNKDTFFASTTVLNEISNFSVYPLINLVTDVMQILELDHDFFDRKVSTLSTTEKIYLNILRNISKSDEIILFKDIFLGLDLNNQKKLVKALNYLKNIGYIILICSSDVDYLYNIAEYSLIATKTFIEFGKTDDIYTDVETLVKHRLEVPTLSYITYKAKKEKNIKLFYSKDVRDIIKDIYKHV